jgi:hypothetical protein
MKNKRAPRTLIWALVSCRRRRTKFSRPTCSNSTTVIAMAATSTTKAPIKSSVDPTLLESP